MAVPLWLVALSTWFVAVSLALAVIVIVDLAQRPQPMWIMNLVWPLTVLYAGPFGVVGYFWIGRAGTRQHSSGQHHGAPPGWRSVLVGATHCGAGCALGDFIAEWLAFAAALTLPWMLLLSFVLAYLAGIFFQFFSIAPMRGLGLKDGLVAAVKADTLSLVAYEVGMFAWMVLVRLVLFPGLEPTGWAFWFMMQIAMMLGLVTTMPVNAWLIRAGIKEAM